MSGQGGQLRVLEGPRTLHGRGVGRLHDRKLPQVLRQVQDHDCEGDQETNHGRVRRHQGQLQLLARRRILHFGRVGRMDGGKLPQIVR